MRHVLLITSTSELAADLLVLAGARRGLSIIRLNQDEFPGRVGVRWMQAESAVFSVDGKSFGEKEIGGAWFRRAPRPKAADGAVSDFAARERAAFLSGVWETAQGWQWMNLPSAVSRAEHKLLQLRLAREVG